MNQFYRIVSVFLNNNPNIFLANGRSYNYLGNCSTRINGDIHHQAFEYQIGANNRKRITIEYIYFMQQHWLTTGQILSRVEMLTAFPFELLYRPCYYTVARFITQHLPLVG